jgi:phage baseplate assembly protein gpV
MRETRHLIEALARSAQQDWRIANSRTSGPVVAVDAVAGKARIRLGGTDEEPFLVPWVRYAQTMGALKVHSAPSIGQQMDLHSDNGDFEQGTLHPRTQSDANPSPSDKPDEHVLTFGPWTFTLKSGQWEVEGPDIVFTANGSGHLA